MLASAAAVTDLQNLRLTVASGLHYLAVLHASHTAW